MILVFVDRATKGLFGPSHHLSVGPGNPSPQDECGCWSEAADANRNWWIVPSLDMNNLSVTITNSDLEIVYEP